MKIYKPPQRLVELGQVLQYDREVFKCDFKEEPFLTWNDRLQINRERARILANDYTFKQQEPLEAKITLILLEIKQHNWKPLNEIQYDKNF